MKLKSVIVTSASCKVCGGICWKFLLSAGCVQDYAPNYWTVLDDKSHGQWKGTMSRMTWCGMQLPSTSHHLFESCDYQVIKDVFNMQTTPFGRTYHHGPECRASQIPQTWRFTLKGCSQKRLADYPHIACQWINQTGTPSDETGTKGPIVSSL